MTDQTTQTPATEEGQVQLQLQDLMASAQVIQLASQRGAIRAEEMATVGALYNRLVTFLQASGALTPATPEGVTASETPAEPASTDAPAAE